MGRTQLVRAVPSTAVAPDLGAPNADHDCEPLRDQMRQIMTSGRGIDQDGGAAHPREARPWPGRASDSAWSVAQREPGTGGAADCPGGKAAA